MLLAKHTRTFLCDQQVSKCLVVSQAVASVVDKPMQEKMKEGVLEEGLENHSTQGSHGVNYHHPEQGDTGYQFFMPSRKFQ